MDHAEFVNAFMPGIWMNSARLRRANFASAVLEGVVAQKADMTNAVLGDADAAMANFRRATFKGAYMDGIAAPGADFVAANLRRANLGAADLSYALLNIANLSNAYLRDATLRGARLHRARAARVDLQDAVLTGADLVDTDLSGAWLGRTRLGRVTISDVNFTGANLVSLLIDHDGTFWFGKTNFTDARLSWVAFRNADMRHAVFDGPEALAYTFADGSVNLPEGMPRPCHWVDAVLDDRMFHSHWRGLTQATNLQPFWEGMGDPAFDDVSPVAPPAECSFPEMDPQDAFAWERAFYDDRAAQ